MGQKNAMRDLTAQQAKTNATNSAADRTTMMNATGRQTGALDKQQSVADMLLPGKNPSGGPGSFAPMSLSPFAGSEFAAASNNIADTYGKQREAGLRALGSSGFGDSPGAKASFLNTSMRNQGADTTGAFRNATQTTLNNMLTGAGLEGDISQGFGNVSRQFGGQSNTESGMSTDQAKQRIGMGSMAGDVLSGISELAPIVAAPFTGGATLMPFGKNTSSTGAPGGGFSNVTRPTSKYASSGVGGYSPYAGGGGFSGIAPGNYQLPYGR